MFTSWRLSFQSPLDRVFFFNSLYFRASVFDFAFQSPLYRVFFFNENSRTPCEGLNVFQSPLYRVFFFNSWHFEIVNRWWYVSVPIISGLLFQRTYWMLKATLPYSVSVPIISGLLFQLGSIGCDLPSPAGFQSPLYRVFFFNRSIRFPVRLSFPGFSPHYIGSSFSTWPAQSLPGLVKNRFSPHYIGSSFSTRICQP